MSLLIQIRDNKTAFSPRERVSGEASWQLEAPPKSAELRLIWTTTGRGLGDMGVVETIPLPNPHAIETRPFTFTLPDGPYSFSGSFITLTWALELTIEPGNQLGEIEIIVAPGGQPVLLPRIASA
jgi:hypothetical protein